MLFTPGNTYQLASDMTATGVTSVTDAGQVTVWSMVFIWTGTPTGAVKVQASPDQTTWTDLPGSSQVTGGTDGSHTVNYSGSGHRYLRGSLDLSSGTISLAVKWTGK
jgi:hypothetical protein